LLGFVRLALPNRTETCSTYRRDHLAAAWLKLDDVDIALALGNGDVVRQVIIHG